MSQSLFRLSINTARSIKITSNSSFCECLSCLLLKHCFQFRKICAFFSHLFLQSHFLHISSDFGAIQFQLQLQLQSSTARSAIRQIILWERPEVPKLNFQLLYVVVVCVHRLEAYVSPRTHVCVLHLSFHFAADTSQSFLCFVIHRNASAAFFANFRRD